MVQEAKETQVSLRIEERVLEDFKLACSARDRSVSSMLRLWMKEFVLKNQEVISRAKAGGEKSVDELRAKLKPLTHEDMFR